jgi:hypothetical protein
MNSIKIGQLVRIENSKKAVICYKCEHRPGYWGVIYMDNKAVDCVHNSVISPYIHICWNCGAGLNSQADTTCPVCYWLKCPNCGACRKGGCIKADYLQVDGQEKTSR